MSLEILECQHDKPWLNKPLLNEKALPTKEEFLRVYKDVQNSTKLVMQLICKDCADQEEEFKRKNKK